MSLIVDKPSLSRQEEYYLSSKRQKFTGYEPFSEMVQIPKFSDKDKIKLQFPDLTEDVSRFDRTFYHKIYKID